MSILDAAILILWACVAAGAALLLAWASALPAALARFMAGPGVFDRRPAIDHWARGAHPAAGLAALGLLLAGGGLMIGGVWTGNHQAIPFAAASLGAGLLCWQAWSVLARRAENLRRLAMLDVLARSLSKRVDRGGSARSAA